MDVKRIHHLYKEIYRNVYTSCSLNSRADPSAAEKSDFSDFKINYNYNYSKDTKIAIFNM